MKAEVSQDTCIGCGLCPSIEPEVFKMGDDGKAHVIQDPLKSEYEDTAKEAEENCPVNAIGVK